MFLQTETTIEPEHESLDEVQSQAVQSQVVAEVADDEDQCGEQFAAPQGFHVHDENSANWVMRKINEARDRQKRMKGFKADADREIKACQKEEAFFLERFGEQLQSFVTPLLESGRRKSFKLVEGTLGFRKRAARLEVQDEDAALAWARINCPQAVLVIERLSKTALQQHFDATGEEPSGCAFVLEAEEFYVK